MQPPALTAPFPRATPLEVISKILYPRQRYHFGPGRIADYLRRFHRVTVARSTVHRILVRHGMNRLPANQTRKPTGRAWQRYEKPQPEHRLQLTRSSSSGSQVPASTSISSPLPMTARVFGCSISTMPASDPGHRS